MLKKKPKRFGKKTVSEISGEDSGKTKSKMRSKTGSKKILKKTPQKRSKKTKRSSVKKAIKKRVNNKRKNKNRRKNKNTKKQTRSTTKHNTKQASRQTPKLLATTNIKRLKVRPHPVEVMLKLIIALSILGIVVSGYLIYLHYKPEASEICTFNAKFNCDVVNKSDYATFMGIPNAIIGSLGYLYFLIMSVILLKGYNLRKMNKKLRPKHLNFLMMIFAGIGWLFSMYLLYIEKFVLYAYCIFCLASLAIITLIFLISIFSYRQCMKCKNVLHKIQMKARGNMCRYC